MLQPLLAKLLEVPHWVRLRFVSNSTAAKATILVPIIGYLIIFNEKVLGFLNLARELGGVGDAQISYRLILIYFGLCAISLGAMIYGWYCPNEVKHYGSAAAYVNGDGPSLRGFVIDEIGSELESSAQRQKLEAATDAQRAVAEMRVLTDADHQKYRTEILHLYFAHLDTSHPLARAICFRSYVLGFVLLAIPSSIVFVRIILLLCKKLFVS
jgi:hypothetical protein